MDFEQGRVKKYIKMYKYSKKGVRIVKNDKKNPVMLKNI